MNTKWFKLAILLTSVFFLSSCFEIIEELSLNEDGSGTFTYTVNLSQSKTKITSIMKLDSVNGYKIPKKESIQTIIDQTTNTFDNMEGININKVKTDFENFIFSLSCNFTSIAALNNAINNAVSSLEAKNFTPTDNFTFSHNTFTRHNKYDTYDGYNKLKSKDQIIFDNAKYTAIYRFKKDILSFTNANAKKSKSGKALMLETDIIDLITKKNDIQNSIILGK